MQDWFGVTFFILLIIGVIFGLKMLATPRTRTSDEFERNAAEGSTGLGSVVNALQEAIDPAAAKAKEVQVQMKDGRYQKKKEDGKTVGDAENNGRGGAK